MSLGFLLSGSVSCKGSKGQNIKCVFRFHIVLACAKSAFTSRRTLSPKGGEWTYGEGGRRSHWTLDRVVGEWTGCGGGTGLDGGGSERGGSRGDGTGWGKGGRGLDREGGGESAHGTGWGQGLGERFRVGSISSWLTLLPMQILRTYNNQYPRLFETLLSLQRCPEGICLSFSLLAAPFRISE